MDKDDYKIQEDDEEDVDLYKILADRAMMQYTESLNSRIRSLAHTMMSQCSLILSFTEGQQLNYTVQDADTLKRLVDDIMAMNNKTLSKEEKI